MEIEVTEKKKVNISFAQRQKVMLQTMKDLAEWKEGMWFDQEAGKMMQTNEYIGSHSFDEESVVREANEMDMAVHLFVLALNEKWNIERRKNIIHINGETLYQNHS